jgi:hypothetical protein
MIKTGAKKGIKKEYFTKIIDEKNKIITSKNYNIKL